MNPSAVVHVYILYTWRNPEPDRDENVVLLGPYPNKEFDVKCTHTIYYNFTFRLCFNS